MTYVAESVSKLTKFTKPVIIEPEIGEDKIKIKGDTVPPKIKHIITDLDHDSKMATCVICGPTTFYSNGPGKWRCSYLEKQRAKTNQDAGRALVKAFKEKPCTDCGISYPYYVVDSDHVRGEKLGNISAMINRPLPILKAEIAKCDNVCSNCHRERTHQRGYPNALRTKKFTET